MAEFLKKKAALQSAYAAGVQQLIAATRKQHEDLRKAGMPDASMLTALCSVTLESASHEANEVCSFSSFLSSFFFPKRQCARLGRRGERGILFLFVYFYLVVVVVVVVCSAG